MKQNLRSERWEYKLGQFLGVCMVAAVMYGLYGLLYWFVNGETYYFGPWEWGLCLITFMFFSFMQRAYDRIKEKESQDIELKAKK